MIWGLWSKLINYWLEYFVIWNLSFKSDCCHGSLCLPEWFSPAWWAWATHKLRHGGVTWQWSSAFSWWSSGSLWSSTTPTCLTGLVTQLTQRIEKNFPDKKIIESYIYGIFSNEFKTCNTYHHILLYFSKI